jgi:hypothetical protein
MTAVGYWSKLSSYKEKDGDEHCHGPEWTSSYCRNLGVKVYGKPPLSVTHTGRA